MQEEGNKAGRHTTQVPSSLSSPTALACNSPDHLGTLTYTPPYTHTPSPPNCVFAIRSVATREPCSIGEAGGMVVGGRLPSPGACASPPPTPLIQPSATGGGFAKATRPRPRPLPRRLGVGAGGGRPPAHRKQTAAGGGAPAAGSGAGPGSAQQTGRTEAGRALEGEAWTPSLPANPGAHRPPSNTSLPQGVSCELPDCDRVTGAPGKAEAGSGYPPGAPSPPGSWP